MSKYIFYKSVDRNVSKEEVLKAVLENGLNLSLYRNYNNDYDIVLSAVSRNGMMLEYASSKLRGDYFIVHAALKQNYAAFRFANLSLDKLNYSKDVLSDIADFFGYEFVSEESLIVSRIKSLEDKRRKIDREIWNLKCELKDCELGSSKVLSK